MCYIPIYVALSFIGTYPRPIFVVGLSSVSVEKLGVRPKAFLAALLRSLYIASSFFSVKIPRWVAWYLDLNNWSVTSWSRIYHQVGGTKLFVRSVASFRTSRVICLRWSRKSSMG